MDLMAFCVFLRRWEERMKETEDQLERDSDIVVVKELDQKIVQVCLTTREDMKVVLLLRHIFLVEGKEKKEEVLGTATPSSRMTFFRSCQATKSSKKILPLPIKLWKTHVQQLYVPNVSSHLRSSFFDNSQVQTT